MAADAARETDDYNRLSGLGKIKRAPFDCEPLVMKRPLVITNRRKNEADENRRPCNKATQAAFEGVGVRL
jgi:hypothetical protein